MNISFILLILNAAFTLAAHPRTLMIFPKTSLKRFHRRAMSPEVMLENGRRAQKLNKKYLSITAETACESGEQACLDGGFAQCVGGKFVSVGCATPLKCFELPLLLKPGSTPSCDSEAEAESRIADTGATGGIRGDANSTTIDGAATNSSTEAQSMMNATKTDMSSTTDPASTSTSNTTSLNATDTGEDDASESEDNNLAPVESANLTDNQTDASTKPDNTTAFDAGNDSESTASPVAIFPANATLGNANFTLHDPPKEEDY